jgi:hypothetical protein
MMRFFSSVIPAKEKSRETFAPKKDDLPFMQIAKHGLECRISPPLQKNIFN